MRVEEEMVYEYAQPYTIVPTRNKVFDNTKDSENNKVIRKRKIYAKLIK
jgi:hypothetical protein